jgi:hypothetical protein
MNSSDNQSRSPRAFEVDASWYQAYWYRETQPKSRWPALLPFRLFVWAAVFCAAAYIVQ